MKITNMKERKQKIFASSKTCPHKDRTASDGYVEGQTFMWITENNFTSNDYRFGNGLLEAILSHKYLNAGVMYKGHYEESYEGVPQGGPLSPLLGNILLNELDRELETRGHKFVRYADDMVILCKSWRSAHRTMKSIVSFIEEKEG